MVAGKAYEEDKPTWTKRKAGCSLSSVALPCVWVASNDNAADRETGASYPLAAPYYSSQMLFEARFLGVARGFTSLFIQSFLVIHSTSIKYPIIYQCRATICTYFCVCGSMNGTHSNRQWENAFAKHADIQMNEPSYPGTVPATAFMPLHNGSHGRCIRWYTCRGVPQSRTGGRCCLLRFTWAHGS